MKCLNKVLMPVFIISSFFLVSLLVPATLYGQTNICPTPVSQNLSLNKKSTAVKNLQIILNKDPQTQVAITGPGSPGMETTFFGSKTLTAVNRFQKKYAAQVLTPAGLRAPSGFVGALTRAKANSLCLQYASAISTPAPVLTQVQPAPTTPTPTPVTTQPTQQTVTRNLLGSCSSNPSSIYVGANTTWTASVSGGDSPYSYSWTDTTGQVSKNQSFSKTYSTSGIKQVSVTVKSGTQTVTVTCQLTVNPQPEATKPLSSPEKVVVVQPTQPVQPATSTPVVPTPTVPTPTVKTYAYAWAGSPASNIIPFVWARKDNISNVSSVKAQLDSQPAGHHVLFDWDIAEKINTNPNDLCTNPNTQTKQPCPWWDNGIAQVKATYEQFFSNLKQTGVTLDTLILDYESSGLSNWALGGTSVPYENTAYTTIENDPRFPVLKQNLISLGFPSGDTLGKVWDYRSSEDYLIWNELVGETAAGYLNTAAFNVAKKYFPNIKASNYQYYLHSPNYPVPDFNGHKIYKYGTGYIFGTHQAPSLYGSIGGLVNFSLDGKNKYVATPWNAFLYSTNELRAAKLASSYPVKPWISHKIMLESLWQNSDLYQEHILHILMAGADGILYWNPHPTPGVTVGRATDEQDKLVNDTLAEFDSLLGYPDKRTLVTHLSAWDSDYVLSGMQAAGRTVWRFTPKLENVSLQSTVVQQANPVILKTAKGKITIPNASIVTGKPTVSTQGYWIIQTNTLPITEERIAQKQSESFWHIVQNAFKDTAAALGALLPW